MLDSLTLLENEEIIFETKTINKQFKRINIGLFICLIFFFSIILFYMNNVSLFSLEVFYLILLSDSGVIFVIVLNLIKLNLDLREINSIYIITNRRAVKVRGNGLIHRDPHLCEIYLEDIAFIQIDTFINVVQTGPRGEIHYKGNEVKTFNILPPWKRLRFGSKYGYLKLYYKLKRRTSQIEQKSEFNDISFLVKGICFNIKGKNTLQIRQNIIDILKDLIPIKKLTGNNA